MATALAILFLGLFLIAVSDSMFWRQQAKAWRKLHDEVAETRDKALATALSSNALNRLLVRYIQGELVDVEEILGRKPSKSN